MKRYPPHHHMFDVGRPGQPILVSNKVRCPICLVPGVMAYAIEDAKPVYARKKKKKDRK